MAKRVADIELNADNYDQDFEKVERGTFQKADDGALKTRTILTARRSANLPSNEVKTHGLLKDFGGFKNSLTPPKPGQLFQFGATATSTPDENKSTHESKNGLTDSFPPEYLKKLASLNKACLKWMDENLKEDPICILTPIFVDYNNHLKDLESKYLNKTESSSSIAAFKFHTSNDTISTSETAADTSKTEPSGKPTFNFNSSTHLNAAKSDETPKPMFSFGSGQTSSAASTGFSFKPAENETAAATKPLFNFGSSVTTSASSTGIFSFNSSTPSFLNSSGPKVESEANNEEDAEYVPPEAEKSEAKEEGAVFEIRCKLFYRNGDSWKDRGIGNAFIKPVEGEEKKFQLVVRADNKLSQIMLNIMVNESIPVTMQKNTVSVFCVANPPIVVSKDEAPMDPNKPCMMMMKVKTEQMAKDFFDQINSNRGK